MPLLADVKEIIGIPVDTTSFDKELLFTIRSVVSALPQLGVDGYIGLSIDETTEWPILEDPNLEQLVQLYLIKKVKNEFDPKANQAVAATLNEYLVELEGRIMLIAEELSEEVI